MCLLKLNNFKIVILIAFLQTCEKQRSGKRKRTKDFCLFQYAIQLHASVTVITSHDKYGIE